MNESDESFLAWKAATRLEGEVKRLLESAGLEYETSYEQTKKLARYVAEENSKLATQLAAAAARLDAIYAPLPPYYVKR